MTTVYDKRKLNRAAASILMSPGEMIRHLRLLKAWSQNDLADATSISQANLSAIENGRIEIGKQRAIAIAEALRVHPAAIMFSDYERVA